jgi:DNA-binding PadR family transcriptional regulator
MSDDVLRHMFLGFMRLHVLYHAGKEPICGAELMQELRHHGYDIGPGTLYPMLHQMQEGGLITSEDTTVDGKRRKNLRLTPNGRKVLAKARDQLKELVGEVLDDKDARELRGRK